MSMNFYESRGYGVQFDENNGENTTGDNIRAMLEFAPELRKEVNNWLEECEINPDTAQVEDYAEFDQDFCNGIPYLIAEAMNEYYGHEFMCAESDENGTIFLYMPCGMPWELSEFERSLTVETFEHMLNTFCGILYEKTLVPDNVSIQNFG